MVPGPTGELDPLRKLRQHHFPSIQLAPIHHEGAIANCVYGSLLFSQGIEVSGDPFEDNDVVLLDDIDNSAFDIRQTFLNQGRSDMLSLQRRQSERLELIRVGA